MKHMKQLQPLELRHLLSRQALFHVMVQSDQGSVSVGRSRHTEKLIQMGMIRCLGLFNGKRKWDPSQIPRISQLEAECERWFTHKSGSGGSPKFKCNEVFWWIWLRLHNVNNAGHEPECYLVKCWERIRTSKLSKGLSLYSLFICTFLISNLYSTVSLTEWVGFLEPAGLVIVHPLCKTTSVPDCVTGAFSVPL